MKVSFSEQIRQAVRECGTTRYSLSKQIGISESTLSRFLSGQRGLTLDLLDKLADALGLQVVVTVQMTQRPSKRGRKKKKEVVDKMKSPSYWRKLAKNAAKVAGENYFSSRRGIWHLADLDVLCVYNNNPYAADPTLRDKETAQFREWLKQQGIKELAYDVYPEEGEEDAGYTYAMLLDASQDRMQEIQEKLLEIIFASFRRVELEAGKK